MRYHVQIENKKHYAEVLAWCVESFGRQIGPTSKLRFYSLSPPSKWIKFSFAREEDALMFALRWK